MVRNDPIIGSVHEKHEYCVESAEFDTFSSPETVLHKNPFSNESYPIVILISPRFLTIFN